MQHTVELTDFYRMHKETGPRSNMHVHHIDYDRVGNESLGDLVVVCGDCHRKLHEFFNRMVSKGFDRRRVMKKIKPYCTRRLVLIHKIHAYQSKIRFAEVNA
jgi:DNA-directed RNA polymerase subunit N (RpoN/RPB10)